MLTKMQGTAIEKQAAPELTQALTPTSWVPREDIDLSGWVEHGHRLGIVGRAAGWWIGDWLRYGNLKFGERYARAARITGYDPHTLMNMVYVASAYDVSQRRPGLSFSHHAELAALPPEERDLWLDRAEQNRLSVRCLREELRRVRRLEESGAREPALPSGDADEEETVSMRCPHCGSELHEPLLAAAVQR